MALFSHSGTNSGTNSRLIIRMMMMNIWNRGSLMITRTSINKMKIKNLKPKDL